MRPTRNKLSDWCELEKYACIVSYISCTYACMHALRRRYELKKGGVGGGGSKGEVCLEHACMHAYVNTYLHACVCMYVCVLQVCLELQLGPLPQRKSSMVGGLSSSACTPMDEESAEQLEFFTLSGGWHGYFWHTPIGGGGGGGTGSSLQAVTSYLTYLLTNRSEPIVTDTSRRSRWTSPSRAVTNLLTNRS